MVSANRHSVLLVVDDPTVGKMIERILEDAGYGFEVCCLKSPEEAQEAFRHQEFDLLLCDVAMPGGDGPELAHAITAEHPHVRVILLSGAPDRLLTLEPGWVFIEKPFRRADLVAHARDLLGMTDVRKAG